MKIINLAKIGALTAGFSMIGTVVLAHCDIPCGIHTGENELFTIQYDSEFRTDILTEIVRLGGSITREDSASSTLYVKIEETEAVLIVKDMTGVIDMEYETTHAH